MGDLLDKLEKENKQETKQLKLYYDESIVNQIISGLFETSRLPHLSDHNDNYRNYRTCLGYHMIKGSIEVNGEISDISDNCKGTIYHKNKLIIKNGKKV